MFNQAWIRCRANFKANLIAGAFIWMAGAIICFSYYKIDKVAYFLNQIGELKKQSGFLYSALATSFFGGVIPYTLLIFQKSIPSAKKPQWFIFFVLFWAIKGIEVDAFYRFQGWLFGDTQSLRVVFSKVINDLFVYCVFWSAPVTAIFYGWKNANFEWSKVKEIRSARYLISETVFLLLSTWIIWIPAVTLVYSMPSELQIPIFNLTLCFFVLVISYLSPNKANGGIDGTRTRDLRRDRPAL